MRLTYDGADRDRFDFKLADRRRIMNVSRTGPGRRRERRHESYLIAFIDDDADQAFILTARRAAGARHLTGAWCLAAARGSRRTKPGAWPERRARILDALAEADAPLSQRQIRQRAATRQRIVGAILQRLVREGRVRHDAERRYCLVASQSANPSPAANGSDPAAPRFPVPVTHA